MIALSSRGRLLTFALAALSAGCSGGSDQSEAEPKPVVAVQTAVVEAQLFKESIGAIGERRGSRATSLRSARRRRHVC
jgi:hypothetical protein